MANIPVTGGTGLIGSSITDHLARAGHRVVTFDLIAMTDNIDPTAGDVTLLTGDICDTGALAAVAAQHGIDHIVDMAAMLSEGADNDPARTMTVNVGGVASVLAVAREQAVRRVVWASSGAALGAGDEYDGAPVDEAHAIRPDTLYGSSKMAAEIVARATRSSGLDCIAVRPGLVYGLGRLTGGARAFNAAVQNVALGLPAIVPQTRLPFQPMYNRDFAQLIECMLFTTKNDLLPAYNMPAREAVWGDDIAAALRRLLPDAQIKVVASPSWLPVLPLMDGRRAEQDSGFTATHTIDSAFAEMIAEFRARA